MKIWAKSMPETSPSIRSRKRSGRARPRPVRIEGGGSSVPYRNHPAIRIQRDAQRSVLIERMVVADVGNGKIIAIAVDVVGPDRKGTSRAIRPTCAAFVRSPRAEYGEPAIEPFPEAYHAGRIGRRGDRILRQRVRQGQGASHAHPKGDMSIHGEHRKYICMLSPCAKRHAGARQMSDGLMMPHIAV